MTNINKNIYHPYPTRKHNSSNRGQNVTASKPIGQGQLDRHRVKVADPQPSRIPGPVSRAVRPPEHHEHRPQRCAATRRRRRWPMCWR